MPSVDQLGPRDLSILGEGSEFLGRRQAGELHRVHLEPDYGTVMVEGPHRVLQVGAYHIGGPSIAVVEADSQKERVHFLMARISNETA